MNIRIAVKIDELLTALRTKGHVLASGAKPRRPAEPLVVAENGS